MPTTSFLPRPPRVSAAWSILIAITLVLFSAAAAVPHVVRLEPVPNGAVLVQGDTLHASPAVQAVLDAWNPEQPQLFCVTTFGQWPAFLYLKSVEDAGSTKCEGAQLGLAQVPRCPTKEQIADAPPMLIIQCGPRDFRRNTPNVAPLKGDKIA